MIFLDLSEEEKEDVQFKQVYMTLTSLGLTLTSTMFLFFSFNYNVWTQSLLVQVSTGLAEIVLFALLFYFSGLSSIF